MEEFDPQLVAKRSIHGVFAFISRSFVISSINLGRDIVLGFLLAPAVYGVYFIVEQLMMILSYFSDVGLAGALIQKKEPITQEELETTFTAQTLLVLLLCIVFFFLAPFIGMYVQFPKEGVWLLQAFIVAFFLSSLKTIPSVIMERNLEFGKFVVPQVVEVLFYTVTILYFAWQGFGIMSFTYAVLIRAVVGLITIYIICPWKIRISFSKKAFSHLLSFGIPYQLNSILALIKDNLIFILYLSRVLPLDQVGYIGFAMKWAFVPLRQVMDNVIRVTFSSFSRLQHDREALGTAFSKSIKASTALIFPALVGLFIVMPYAIALFPRLHKWTPALVSFDFFLINAALAAVLVPLTNLLNAIGKIKITLNFMILWTVITWIGTPIALYFMGFNGFAFITAVINVSVIPIVMIAKKYLEFNTIDAIKHPVIASTAMGVILFILVDIIPMTIAGLIAMIIVGVAIYAGIFFFIGKKELLSDMKFIRENLRK